MLLMLKGTVFGIGVVDNYPYLACSVCGELRFFEEVHEAAIDWATEHRKTAHPDRRPVPRQEFWLRR